VSVMSVSLFRHPVSDYHVPADPERATACAAAGARGR
jgi:hypothetical protein